MFGNDPQAAADGLAQWAQQLEETAGRYSDLQSKMSGISVTESAGGVSVTVDANGVPTDIQLSGATRGSDPAALSRQIMACMQTAQAELRKRVTTLVSDVVSDDQAGAGIVEQYDERFPDPAPVEPGSGGFTPPPAAPPPVTPPAFAPAAPPAGSTVPGTRKPNRDRVVAPQDPDDDDEFYGRKSWLV